MEDIFRIKVLEVTDNDDGSATVTIEMEEKVRNLLIEAGLISLIKHKLENE